MYNVNDDWNLLKYKSFVISFLEKKHDCFQINVFPMVDLMVHENMS